MISELYFVSSNEGKIKEAQEILGFPIKIAKIELDEIQDIDIEVIVKKKAEAAYAQLKKPVIVDDVGFYVKVWNNFPGPFVKYLIKAGGCSLLLKMLRNEANRDLEVKAAIGFCDGKQTLSFVGVLPGKLAHEERGTNGMGFDPVVIPEGTDKTMAELETSEKNSISHRRRGLDQFKEFLAVYNI